MPDTIICAFCGFEAPMPEKLGDMNRAMAEHIVICENHPLRKCGEEVRRLTLERDYMVAAIATFAGKNKAGVLAQMREGLKALMEANSEQG